MGKWKEAVGSFENVFKVLGLLVSVLAIVVTLCIYRWTHSRADFEVSAVMPEIDVLWFVAEMDREFAEKVKLVVESSEVKGLTVKAFKLANTGEKAILPSDFIEPITLKVEAPWRLIAVTTVKSGSFPGVDSKVSQHWEKKSEQCWEMSPTLFNTGDIAYAVAYAIGDKTTTPSDLLKQGIIKSQGRITDVQSIQPDSNSLGLLDRYAETEVRFRGWQVYLFMMVWFVLSGVFMYVLYKGGIFSRLSWKELLVLAAGSLFCITSAEIITSILLGTIKNQWKGSWVLLLAHVLFLSSLAGYRLRIRVTKESQQQNEDIPQ